MGPDSDERRRHVKPNFEVEKQFLDCIICRNQLTPPVCQCRNGHMACQVCCKTRTSGQCPAPCLKPIGSRRNRAVEDLIANLQVPCKHTSLGCTRLLRTVMTDVKIQHERYECEFIQVECPMPNCKFTSCFKVYSDHSEKNHKGVEVLHPERFGEPLTFKVRFRLDSRDLLVLLKSCPELFLLHVEASALGQMLYITSCGKDKRYSLEVVISKDNDWYDFKNERKTFKAGNMNSAERASSVRDFLLVPKQNMLSHPSLVVARCTVIIPRG